MDISAYSLEPWENATPEQVRKFFTNISEEERMRKLEPVLVPEPEVAAFLDPDRPLSDPIPDSLSEKVIVFCTEQEMLTNLKKSYFLCLKEGWSSFLKLVEDQGEKIIPLIALLRQCKQYDEHITLVMMGTALAKTAPKGELDDEDEGQLLEDCKKAIDEMRAEGYDTDILNMMEANLEGSGEEQIN